MTRTTPSNRRESQIFQSDTAKATVENPAATLSQLRLLAAPDALLRAGSVSGAAAELEMSVPAVSRLLAQLRAHYDDPILQRQGRRMVPSPLAASLRRRVAALGREARLLMAIRAPEAEAISTLSAEKAPSLLAFPDRPRLPLRSADPMQVEGMPDADGILRRLDGVQESDPPRLRLAAHVARLVGAPGQSHALSMAQAEDAFGIILRGEADPVQVGALLTAMQQRGPAGPELAGLIAAARAERPGPGWQGNEPGLDWPVYPSPRQRRPAWFLAAARLIADAGTPVLLHGFTPRPGPVAALLDALQIPLVETMAGAQDALTAGRIAYLRIEGVAPQLAALCNLYAVLGMRTVVQFGPRLLDPMRFGVTLGGVPFGGAGGRLSSAMQHLREGVLLTVLSQRDVAQATPHRFMALALSGPEGEVLTHVPPSLEQAPEALPAGYGPGEMLAALWQGRARDTAVSAVIRDSAAVALMALRQGLPFPEAQAEAARLWAGRRALGG